MKILSLHFLILYANTIIFAQFGSQDTGGPLSPEQAAYDVKYYNINLEIDPVEKSIAGWVGINAQVIKSISFFVLDLDDRYDIALIKLLSTTGKIFMLPFQHNNGQIIIELPYVFNPGELIDIEIHYKGIPRVAERPPWDDGFTWSKTRKRRRLDRCYLPGWRSRYMVAMQGPSVGRTGFCIAEFYCAG